LLEQIRDRIGIFTPLTKFSFVRNPRTQGSGGFIYLAAYLTLAPIFKTIGRTDLDILAPILGQIKILKPVTNLIFANDTRLLNMLERNDES